jgi:soluble lytic murein transglycosylase-like protein
LCISLSAPSSAQDEDFAAWLARDQAEVVAYSDAVTRQYEAYVAAQRKAFEDFVSKVGEKWGRANVWVPEQKVWVQYTNQFEERSSVDFEKGRVRVQMLLPPGAEVDAAARSRMVDAVRGVLLSGTDDPVDAVRRDRRAAARKTSLVVTNEGTETFVHIVQPGETVEGIAAKFGVAADSLRRANRLKPDATLVQGRQLVLHRRITAPPREPPAPPPAVGGKRPLLDGQVRAPGGSPVTVQNAQESAVAIVAAMPPAATAIRGGDGAPRTAVTVEFPMVPEHLRVRAERFRPFVRDYSKRYNVDPALVFAVIHTESCFNPRARSGAPAFGLMQLVPGSGARDAYRYVFKKDALVDGNYLYDPERNIELGTAYLYLLDAQHLRAVRDPLSRRHCAIAAYNTGAGNVSRAFADTRSVAAAAREINTLQPDQVYAQLRSNLPYQETRDYVKRVSDRIPLYEAWR